MRSLLILSLAAVAYPSVLLADNPPPPPAARGRAAQRRPQGRGPRGAPRPGVPGPAVPPPATRQSPAGIGGNGAPITGVGAPVSAGQPGTPATGPGSPGLQTSAAPGLTPGAVGRQDSLIGNGSAPAAGSRAAGPRANGVAVAAGEQGEVMLEQGAIAVNNGNTYQLRFQAGQPVTLTAYATGGVALVVRNPLGIIVGEDLSGKNKAQVQFTPRRTVLFTVLVVNRNRGPVNFRLVMR